jgi:hypothetical protein
LIDISDPAVRKGFTRQFASSIRTLLATLDDQTRVSIVTISQKAVCYNLLTGAAIIPADLSDIAIPFAEPPPILRCRDCLNRILDSIIALEQGDGPGHCLPGGLMTAVHLLGVTGGILIIGVVDQPLATSLPPLLPSDGVKPPDESSVWRLVMNRLSGRAISCHAFVAVSNPRLSDFSFLANTCAYTGGSFFEYGDFSTTAAPKLHIDLFRTLSAEYFWDCTARVRLSGGVRVTRLTGNFHAKGDLVTFPVLPTGRTYIVEIDLPQPLTAPRVIVQLGMLFTTASGERRARVLTFQIPVSPSLQTVVASADTVALAAALARRTLGRQTPLDRGIEAVLALFIANGGSQFPALFRLIHAFVSGPVVRAPEDNAGRSLRNWFADCPVVDLLLWLCPRVFAVDRGIGPLPCIAESFTLGAAFLIHAHDAIYLWVSDAAEQMWVANAIGTDTFERRENSESAGLWQTIDECQQLSGKYLPVTVIRQGDPDEAIVGRMLIDRADRAPPFAEWYRGIVTATGSVTH